MAVFAYNANIRTKENGVIIQLGNKDKDIFVSLNCYTYTVNLWKATTWRLHKEQNKNYMRTHVKTVMVGEFEYEYRWIEYKE